MSEESKTSSNDIDRITAKLEELTLQRNRIKRRRSRLTEQLRTLRGEREDYQLYRNLNIIANREDREGNPLRVGDTVRFVTPGVQTTPEGRVKGFGKRFVKCVDSQGFPVNKEPKSIVRTNLQDNESEQ